MSDRVYGADEKAKLERLVNEGATVMREIEDPNTGPKETVKAVAEELDINLPYQQSYSKVAHKGDWDKVQDEFEDPETLLLQLVKIKCNAKGKRLLD